MKLFGSDPSRRSEAEADDNAQKKQDTTATSEKQGAQQRGSGATIASGRRYIIKRPLLTEKASLLQAEENKYVFLVHPDANKSEIKKEVQRLFDVRVERVNIVNQPRKRKVWRGHVGFSSGDRKAIVTIEEGKKIDILPT